MKEYEKPEEMIYEEISKITEKWKLEREFKTRFPDDDYEEWLKIIDEEYGVREKHVQGMGNFLFFMTKGKTQFHEYVLEKMIKKLKNNRIRYKRGKVRKGADLFIYKESKKYPVELETGLYKDSWKRYKLTQRILNYRDEVIVIVVLNTNQKRKYKQSELPYLPKKVKILTIEETIELFSRRAGKIG